LRRHSFRRHSLAKALACKGTRLRRHSLAKALACEGTCLRRHSHAKALACEGTRLQRHLLVNVLTCKHTRLQRHSLAKSLAKTLACKGTWLQSKNYSYGYRISRKLLKVCLPTIMIPSWIDNSKRHPAGSQRSFLKRLIPSRASVSPGSLKNLP
jgi:hypothetical protein